MINLFDAAKGLLKTDVVCIDDLTFRLHYKVTAAVLMAFSAVVTARQYVGNPIECSVNGVPWHVMDSYCWVYSTFTVGDDFNGGGGGNYGYGYGDGVRHHRYYQWVCFVLFLQALCFSAARQLWKSWEGGRMRTLSAGLRGLEPVAGRTAAVADYMRTRTAGWRAHDAYFLRYVACETLNLANVLGQIALLDWFLDGGFSAHALFRSGDTVFPKLAKCSFNSYGSSGTVQTFDGLCVLPLNAVNEKIFGFLWCWFLFLATASTVTLVGRVAALAADFPGPRVFLLRQWCGPRIASGRQFRIVVDRCGLGGWFVLYQLRKNVDPIAFDELIVELADQYGSCYADSYPLAPR